MNQRINSYKVYVYFGRFQKTDKKNLNYKTIKVINEYCIGIKIFAFLEKLKHIGWQIFNIFPTLYVHDKGYLSVLGEALTFEIFKMATTCPPIGQRPMIGQGASGGHLQTPLSTEGKKTTLPH